MVEKKQALVEGEKYLVIKVLGQIEPGGFP